MEFSRRHFLGLAGAALVTGPVRAESGMRAYDIEILHRSIAEGDARGDGWIFGLPPGISTVQWPLDPNNAYPLQHGFTIRLPEDYRVHGPDIVALSFFSTAFDHNDGAPMVAPAVRALFKARDPERPEDPDLVPFWQSRRDEHPRLFRMRDILDLEYAAILLTEDEFSGGFAQPPDFGVNRHLQNVSPPAWMRSGAARAYWDFEAGYYGQDIEETYLYRQYGGVPEAGLANNRAIALTPRRNDPNAGIPPRETYFNGKTKTTYQRPFYFEGEPGAQVFHWHKWTKGHAANHIGGTMRPAQAVPDFSPYYIEFDEAFGGYNFGFGIAQLDFRDMRFGWAQ